MKRHLWDLDPPDYSRPPMPLWFKLWLAMCLLFGLGAVAVLGYIAYLVIRALGEL